MPTKAGVKRADKVDMRDNMQDWNLFKYIANCLLDLQHSPIKLLNSIPTPTLIVTIFWKFVNRHFIFRPWLHLMNPIRGKWTYQLQNISNQNLHNNTQRNLVVKPRRKHKNFSATNIPKRTANISKVWFYNFIQTLPN